MFLKLLGWLACNYKCEDAWHPLIVPTKRLDFYDFHFESYVHNWMNYLRSKIC